MGNLWPTIYSNSCSQFWNWASQADESLR